MFLFRAGIVGRHVEQLINSDMHLGSDKEMEAWRDLQIGEEVKVGDRFLAAGKWYPVEEIHLDFGREMNECHKPTQRKIEIKEIATTFYYHWHNAPGSNTQQGFDAWWEKNRGSWGL